MPPTPSIAVESLTKNFRENRGLRGWLRSGRESGRIPALSRIQMQVAPGEVFGLVGPNGAGKTTLLKILSTLLLPDDGAARIHGFDVVREGREVRRHLGVMLDSERSFYARLNGRQNLEFFAALSELGRNQPRRRIEELLEVVGVAEVRERQFMKYSLGMQRRLALARALLPDPAVLLLDEPTRSLDPETAAALGRLFRDQFAHRQGKTILLASHSLAEVEAICDRLAILRQGEIVALGSPTELRRRFNSPTLEEVYRKALGSADCVDSR